MIASVGLDKKLYTFDSGTRRPTSCVPYEAPFSSLAFRDDGWTLAAGTSSGRVVFYDVRGKPQPYTVLRAYSSSEVKSFSWIQIVLSFKHSLVMWFLFYFLFFCLYFYVCALTQDAYRFIFIYGPWTLQNRVTHAISIKL